MRALRIPSRLGIALLCVSVLGACGQRGALYLPDEARNVVVTPAPPPAATAPATTEPTEEQRRNATAPAK